MKISPYMNIKRIEFTVTYNCTGRCLHCSVGDNLFSSPEPCVRPREAADTVRRLAQLFPVESVMTFGGEPLLYPDTVCAVHEATAHNSVGARQIITNGYFSKESGRIDEVCARLRDSGVNNILISVDAFHQRTIALEAVHRFVRSAKAAGITGIKLSPAWLVNSQHDNEYNAATREILRSFEPFDIPVGEGNDIFLAGNAAKNLSHYYPPAVIDKNERCGSMPYTESPDDVSCICIVPNGDVSVCAFVIGNIYRESIESIVSRYSPYDNEFMCAVLSGGADALLALAARKGKSIDLSQCRSLCDICRAVRK